MGDVVNLESAAGDRPGARAGGRRRRRRSKAALVLGGGGFTGGVYEIGALRAIDLLATNRTVNQFDVYVGTSAGAFVAASLANGITPEEMMRAIVQQTPTSFPDAKVTTLLRPNYSEFLYTGMRLPVKLAGIAHRLVREWGQTSALDVAFQLSELLPSGLYSPSGLEAYVRTILAVAGRSDDFRTVPSELYMAATDLDTCERIVFGGAGWDDVPISKAVAASSALPMLYKPVKVRGRELIDGGIVSTTNIDIAVEAGAKFIVVVNPLVPYVNDFEHEMHGLTGARPRRVSDMGFARVGYQSFRLLAYQRLHEMARGWEKRYPGVDIILIEPEPNDELMFQTNVMNYASRVDIAKHGFQSVTLRLANDYPHFKRVCARHGVEISGTRVRQVVKHFEAEREPTRAWRKILEQTTSTLLRQSSRAGEADRPTAGGAGG